jgi:predicted nucleic acid-binding protein
MRRSVVLDTDVSSMSIKGRLSPAMRGKLIWTSPIITFVTRGELGKWMLAHSMGRSRRSEVMSWIAQTSFLAGTMPVAEIFGELAAAAQRRGRPRPQNDTWIAACCLARRLPLATFNVKDFQDFAEHHGLELITV